MRRRGQRTRTGGRAGDGTVTTFYLIRHAERLGHPQLLAGRLRGLRLSRRGRGQATQLARALAGEPIDHVFCSPLERARATAAEIARHHRLPMEVSPAINEIDFGEWTGRRWSELERDGRWRKFNSDRANAAAPAGESLANVQMRFVGAMRQFHTSWPHAGIVLVSHADPIKLAVAHCLGWPRATFDRIEVAVASVTVVEFYKDHMEVVRQNASAAAIAA